MECGILRSTLEIQLGRLEGCAVVGTWCVRLIVAPVPIRIMSSAGVKVAVPSQYLLTHSRSILASGSPRAIILLCSGHCIIHIAS